MLEVQPRHCAIVGNGIRQWEWGGNGNSSQLNLGIMGIIQGSWGGATVRQDYAKMMMMMMNLRMGMGMSHWEWEGLGTKMSFPLTSTLYTRPCYQYWDCCSSVSFLFCFQLVFIARQHTEAILI